MLYLVYLVDIEDNMPIRQKLLDDHMEYMGRHLSAIRLGGPLLNAEQQQPLGGMLIVEAPSEREIQAIIEADPYHKAGLWREVHIHPYKPIIDSWDKA